MIDLLISWFAVTLILLIGQWTLYSDYADKVTRKATLAIIATSAFWPVILVAGMIGGIVVSLKGLYNIGSVLVWGTD